MMMKDGFINGLDFSYEQLERQAELFEKDGQHEKANKIKELMSVLGSFIELSRETVEKFNEELS